MSRHFYLLCCCLLLACSGVVQAQVISTITGNGIVGNTGDGGPAGIAQIGQTRGVAVDGAGNMYLVDNSHNIVRKVSAAGIITRFAGTGGIGYGGDDVPATATVFNLPYGIAADAAGNVYIADRDGGRVRKVNTAGIISTVAGGGAANPGDGGAATNASLSPSDVTMDAAGNLYIADAVHNRVRKVNTAGIISTVAGNGVIGYSGDGIVATTSKLWNPQGVGVDNSGNVYIAETDGNRVRKVNAAGIISTIAGTGAAASTGDGGPATAAALNNPWSVASDWSGNIYIGNFSDRRVRKINAEGIISTFAGNGSIGYSGDGGQAPLARVNCPAGMAFRGPGKVYIADYANAVVRLVRDDTVRFTNGHAQAIVACATSAINTLLKADDADAGQKLAWSIVLNPMHGVAAVTYTATATGGTITPAGLTYTPVAGYSGTDSFKVRVTDDMLSDTTTIYVTVHPASPGSLAGPDTVCMGETIVLTAPVGGGTWASSNANATVTASGVVTGVNIGTVTISYTVSNDCITTATILKQIYVAGGYYCLPAAVSGPVGERKGIVVYPNPNKGYFTLSSGLAAKVIVTDLLGQVVGEVSVLQDVPHTVHLDLPAGVYFLSAQTANGQWNEKMIIE